jgi:hypothetical protein
MRCARYDRAASESSCVVIATEGDARCTAGQEDNDQTMKATIRTAALAFTVAAGTASAVFAHTVPIKKSDHVTATVEGTLQHEGDITVTKLTAE